MTFLLLSINLLQHKKNEALYKYINAIYNLTCAHTQKCSWKVIATIYTGTSAHKKCSRKIIVTINNFTLAHEECNGQVIVTFYSNKNIHTQKV